MHPHQTVSEMVEEVLLRQAKILADQTGEPFERAMRATSKTQAARQLEELAGEFGEREAAEWQVRLPWARAEERHYSWLESYMGWLKGKEKRSEYHAFLEEELASLRG